MINAQCYPLDMDIDFNAMQQACELEDRDGRHEYENGSPYTYGARDSYWPQWGIFWLRDSNGIAWSILDDGDVPF